MGLMLGVDQVLHQRYRIVRPLGHGGMGAVYEAIDERFGGPIALKEIVFASSSPQQKELVARAFEREAKALAKAQHEAIPFVRDYFMELDRQFLVMELVEGDDLAGMLAKRQAPFPLIDCLKWMDQLLDALDYLHTLEPPIVHRDIKPQNLKLNRRGRIKLLDFGIAKSSDAGGLTLSNQTFVGATLDYSPIEQILRAIEPTFREYILLRHKEKADQVLQQTTDARCDIYSLGATFYHLLTNQAPPDAVKRTLEQWEGRADPLVDPSSLNQAIPHSVSRCILMAMSIDRDGRYVSALEMQSALHAATSEDESLASRVYNESWKDAQVHRHGVENDRKRREENALMHAETVRLGPDATAEVRAEAGRSLSEQSRPTEPLIVTPPERTTPPAMSISDNYVDLQPTPAFISMASGDLAEARNITTDSISGRNTDVFQAAQLAPPRAAVVIPKRRSRAPLWIAGMGAAGIFMVAGIVGALWIASAVDGTSQNSQRNINSGFPSSTPTAFPTPSPTGSLRDSGLTVEPTPVPTATPTARPTPVRTPESTPRSTPQITPTPVRTPVRTPTPYRTPTPRKAPDPNCIYNNTCKS